MTWVIVGWDEITRWCNAEADDTRRALVLRWIDQFHDGYGFADGVPIPGSPGLYVARVPSTPVRVTFLVRHALEPPALVIRSIEPPAA